MIGAQGTWVGAGERGREREGREMESESSDLSSNSTPPFKRTSLFNLTL